jgi:hypothetical protein
MTTVDRRAHSPLPQPTGAVAELLGVTEPRLAETVRRGHVAPPPTVIAGRRLWTREQVLQAAAALGEVTAQLRQRIDAMFGVVGEEASS